MTKTAPAPIDAPQDNIDQGTLLTPDLGVNPDAVIVRHDWEPETQIAVDAARKILRDRQAEIPAERPPRMTS